MTFIGVAGRGEVEELLDEVVGLVVDEEVLVLLVVDVLVPDVLDTC